MVVSGLQIYATSYPPLIAADPDGIDSFYALIESMKQLSFTSLALYQPVQVQIREKLDKMNQEIAKAYQEAKLVKA